MAETTVKTKAGRRLGLLPRVLIAIALGIALGLVMPGWFVRIFLTFNAIFSQLLGFLIPLIILGLVTAAIGDIGRSAGKMLLVTVAIAYFDTALAAGLGYGVGEALFPSLVSKAGTADIAATEAGLEPYFTINIPSMMDVMTALVFSFIFGLCIAHMALPVMKGFFSEFRSAIAKTIEKLIIPLLPLYIFGIFLEMTCSGKVFPVLKVFAMIILVIFALHILILLYEFCIAGAIARKNPLKLLGGMLPAYFTALGTSSSAATIPVTLKQTVANGVREEVAGFTVPLCATIHMSGSAMKITCCALAVCLMNGMPHSFPMFLEFILMLGIMMVAAPGVPGGAIMAALAPLSSILGFDAEAQALMIALYIAMDSFGTACNVTGDGAISLIIDRLFAHKP
ncbi:MAG: dicarboxylate/amino acid:cation symporter [Bacteroidales bacterium]|nr:dicarboxylate/amino acid:cation symporter [Bacteroidales bacterium]